MTVVYLFQYIRICMAFFLFEMLKVTFETGSLLLEAQGEMEQIMSGRLNEVSWDMCCTVQSHRMFVQLSIVILNI